MYCVVFQNGLQLQCIIIVVISLIAFLKVLLYTQIGVITTPIMFSPIFSVVISGRIQRFLFFTALNIIYFL